MVAIIEQLPSPTAAQPLRLPPLVHGEAKSQADKKAVEPTNDIERALFACTAGTASDPAPLVAYIAKVVSIPRESLPEFSSGASKGDRLTMTADEMRARGRDAVRRELALNRESSTGTPLSLLSPEDPASAVASGTATPIQNVSTSSALSQDASSDALVDAMREKLDLETDPEAGEDEILVGFGRIYSGTVRVGDKIWAMQPKYNAKSKNSQSYLKHVTVRALYMMMGREFVRLKEVPAGNVFGIRGVAGAILKSGTLASDPLKCPNLAAMHSETYPIVRVALEPVNPQDISKLVRGLELLNQADPCVQIISQSTGERVLVTAGELHLERCMKDLRERFGKCEIHVSEPIVPFREGIVRQSGQSGVLLGEVGSSGQSLAIISKTTHTKNIGDLDGQTEEHARTKPTDSQIPRGEVSMTTANGMVTITVQIEPLPEKTTRFLLRHEDDIGRVVKLASASQRRNRLYAASEALEQSDSIGAEEELENIAAAINIDSDEDEDNDESIETKTAKPSKTSELGPWLQSRLRTTFRRAKGWEPQRVEHAMANGLWAFGPRRVGPNMLLYSEKMIAQSSKAHTSWFNPRSHNAGESSSGTTPAILSSPDESDSEEHSEAPTAPVSVDQGKTVQYSIRDFEESINTGFQLAAQSGPLCFEPLAGVAVTVKNFVYNGGGSGTSSTVPTTETVNSSVLSGQIITTVRDAIKTGYLQWSPRLYLAMYTCDIQATSEVLGKVYAVINRRRGRILSEEMREGTPYFTIKAAIPIVESFGFADDIRKRTSGAAIPLLLFRGYEPLDTDPFWVPTTEEELEDLGEKADRENVAKKYMEKVRKRKGLFVERKIVEHAEKQRTLKK
ncbi:Cytoplasmic GTPase/eEF2-like protein (ribosomal biogenesis) [Coemansia sp. RSA 2607]|nr:Cytoplasmic GTPase/eEF2-like protein (ribosomal biogenesis) [Coemansia sp. RSA 2607]